MNECFLGVDIGTGSSKAAIVDIKGHVLCQASVPHKMSTPRPGWYEQDADNIWWGDLLLLCRKLLGDLRQPKESIKGLALSTIGPCVLPVDKAGNPLRPGILYGIDTRAETEIREIEEQLGKDVIFAKTGQDLSTQSCCPKIRWIRKNEPEVWKKTAKILTATGYLVYRLTGRFTLDIYTAIGFAPIFDLTEKNWDPSLTGSIMEIDQLPELLWSSQIAGELTQQAAELTGLPPGLPVITGTTDAAAEALGAGVEHTGDMMMMYGSSNFFILKTESLRPVRSFWASNFLAPGSYVLTGGMSTVGSMFKWFGETFPGRSVAEWENLARQSSPGAGGITSLPYFAGERTPLHDPNAKGVIFGMSLSSTPGDLYRSLQEAVGYGIRHNIEELEKAGARAARILAIGGASESRHLMQIVTDITGCSQNLPQQKLGACYGDAFLAAVGSNYLHSTADIGRWVCMEDEIKPSTANQEIYDKGYERFRKLYKSTRHLLG
ncbi:MAG: FGGY-family carbohydrate kinase [Desulfobacterales bacterium]|nr:FGGY-family carbohydrate kinase [Desulfobacterales bacterium]